MNLVIAVSGVYQNIRVALKSPEECFQIVNRTSTVTVRIFEFNAYFILANRFFQRTPAMMEKLLAKVIETANMNSPESITGVFPQLVSQLCRIIIHFTGVQMHLTVFNSVQMHLNSFVWTFNQNLIAFYFAGWMVIPLKLLVA